MKLILYNNVSKVGKQIKYNTMNYVSTYRYSLSFHTFQIVSVITQELSIMVLSEFDKRVLKAKIDFLINVSKFEILFIANISLALLRRQRPNNLRSTLLYCIVL